MLRQMGVFVALKLPPRPSAAGFSYAQSEASMPAPTIRISAQLVGDLNTTLARLRESIKRYPDHEEVFDNHWHHDCEICFHQRRLQWLCDKLPRSKAC